MALILFHELSISNMIKCTLNSLRETTRKLLRWSIDIVITISVGHWKYIIICGCYFYYLYFKHKILKNGIALPYTDKDLLESTADFQVNIVEIDFDVSDKC